MQGTKLRDLDILTRATMEHFANMSGYDITAQDIMDRDKVVPYGIRDFPDEWDDAVLAIQDRYISASDLGTPEETQAVQKECIEQAIALLRQ